MMLSVVHLRLTVNKMILKYQSGRKHELTNDYDETSSGEGIVRYSKPKTR